MSKQIEELEEMINELIKVSEKDVKWMEQRQEELRELAKKVIEKGNRLEILFNECKRHLNLLTDLDASRDKIQRILLIFFGIFVIASFVLRIFGI